MHKYILLTKIEQLFTVSFLAQHTPVRADWYIYTYMGHFILNL